MESHLSDTPVLWPQLVPRSQLLAMMADLQAKKEQIRNKSEEVELLKENLSKALNKAQKSQEMLETAEKELRQLQLMMHDMVPLQELQNVKSKLCEVENVANEDSEKLRNSLRVAVERGDELQNQFSLLARTNEVKNSLLTISHTLVGCCLIRLSDSPSQQLTCTVNALQDSKFVFFMDLIYLALVSRGLQISMCFDFWASGCNREKAERFRVALNSIQLRVQMWMEQVRIPRLSGASQLLCMKYWEIDTSSDYIAIVP